MTEQTGARTRYFRSTLGVFQGGGCRAAAYAGAYEVAHKAGVSFVEVAGASAGSIVAALIAAGATPSQLISMLQELDFKKFPVSKQTLPLGWRNRMYSWLLSLKHWHGLDTGSILFHEGMHSSEYIEEWMEEQLKKILGRGPSDRGLVNFNDLLIPLSVVATDLSTQNVKIWNKRNNGAESVARAVRASCSIPIFFQPVDAKYVDGGVLSNLPAFVYSIENATDAPLASRVLAFSLQTDSVDDSAHYFMRLANTVVDGGQEIQSILQGGIPSIRIPTGDVKATDFGKMTSEKTNNLIERGRVAARAFFAEEGLKVGQSAAEQRTIPGLEEFYAIFIESAKNTRSVIISDFDPGFVFPLFPTLMHLRVSGASVVVYLPDEKLNDDKNRYKIELLRQLGCKVYIGIVRYRAYLIDPGSVNAIAFVKPLSKDDDHKAGFVQYRAPGDASAIDALVVAILKNDEGPVNFLPILSQMRSEDVIFRLRKVAQYRLSETEVTLQRIPIADLYSLAKYGREYKVKQIEYLYQAFAKAELTPFSPATITLMNGQKSIVTPPVVEVYGDKYLLIEGTSRAIFSRDQGFPDLVCLVVRNPDGQLPATHRPLAQVRLVGRSLGPDERYEGWNYGQFRHIESEMHKLNDIT